MINILNKGKYVKKDGSFDYLLNISIKEMSKDSVNKLNEHIKKIQKDINALEKKTPEQLWISDLTELSDQLK